jgi:hypothetical protein
MMQDMKADQTSVEVLVSRVLVLLFCLHSLSKFDILPHRHSVKRRPHAKTSQAVRDRVAHLGLSLLHWTYATIQSGLKLFRGSIRRLLEGFSFPARRERS